MKVLRERPALSQPWVVKLDGGSPPCCQFAPAPLLQVPNLSPAPWSMLHPLSLPRTRVYRPLDPYSERQAQDEAGLVPHFHGMW